MISTASALQVVNAVGLEAYVEGVVAAEMPSNWPAAALEAQAVAARSYALANLADTDASTFDLYSDTRSQVYGGIAAETPATTRPSTRPRTRSCSTQGKVATRYFSSSSGGRTVSAAEAIGTRSRISSRSPIPTTRSRRTTTGARCSVGARGGRKALKLAGRVPACR